MFELILLFIALVTLSLSSGAAAFFCSLAVVVIVIRNRTVKQNLARLQQDLADQTDALRREIRSTRDAVEKVSTRLSETNLTSAEIDSLRREIRSVRELVEKSPILTSTEHSSVPETGPTPTVAPSRDVAPVPTPSPIDVPKEVPRPSPVAPETKPVVPAPVATPAPPPVSQPLSGAIRRKG